MELACLCRELAAGHTEVLVVSVWRHCSSPREVDVGLVEEEVEVGPLLAESDALLAPESQCC